MRTMRGFASSKKSANRRRTPSPEIATVPVLELMMKIAPLKLFDRRSKSFNGAIFIMSSSTGTVAISGEGVLRRFADFFELAKPRIVLMVLVTAFVGFYVGSEK